MRFLLEKIKKHFPSSPLVKGDFGNFVLKVILASALPVNALAADILVTHTRDTGAGSFREAIHTANKATEASQIIFQIDETDVNRDDKGRASIWIYGPLPDLAAKYPITIDAQKQIILDGNKSKSKFPGLTITRSNHTVAGLVIRNFGAGGILVHGSEGQNVENVTIKGNQILENGIYDEIGNSGDAIRLAVNVRNCLIYDNLIARNRGNGIMLQSLTSAVWGNRIFGNYISSNQKNGLRIEGSRNITGLNPDNVPDPNIIVQNELHGVLLHGDFAHGNTIAYDYIGLGPDEKVLGNKLDGIHLKLGAKNNRIGPSLRLYGNTSGVVIKGQKTIGNEIFENEIITNLDAGILIEQINLQPLTKIYENKIQQNQTEGLHIIGSSPMIGRNIISDNANHGLRIESFDDGNPEIYRQDTLHYASPSIEENQISRNRLGGIYALDTIFPGWETIERKNTFRKNFNYDVAVDWYHALSFKPAHKSIGAIQAEITSCQSDRSACLGSTLRESGDRYYIGPDKRFNLQNRSTYFKVRHFEVRNGTRQTHSPHQIILTGDEDKTILLSDLDRAQSVLGKITLDPSLQSNSLSANSQPHLIDLGVYGRTEQRFPWIWVGVGVVIIFWLYHFWIAGHKVRSQNQLFANRIDEVEAEKIKKSVRKKTVKKKKTGKKS